MDFAKLASSLRQAQYLYLIPALVAYFLGVWIRAIRWHYLLAPIRAIPAPRLFPIVVIGYMANDILPARMGELVRAYVLGRRSGIRKSTSLATIIVERTFDGVTMLLFLAFVSILVPFGAGLQQILRLSSFLFVTALGMFFVFAFWPTAFVGLSQMLIRLLPHRFQGRARQMATSFLSGFQAMKSWRTLLSITALSVIAWLFETTMYYVISLGFNLTIPAHAFLLTVALANLGTLVPSSPGYVGTFDGIAIFSLSLYGVTKELAASYTIVLHAALWLPVTLAGFYYLWRENLSLQQIETVEEEITLAQPTEGSVLGPPIGSGGPSK